MKRRSLIVILALVCMPSCGAIALLAIGALRWPVWELARDLERADSLIVSWGELSHNDEVEVVGYELRESDKIMFARELIRTVQVEYLTPGISIARSTITVDLYCGGAHIKRVHVIRGMGEGECVALARLKAIARTGEEVDESDVEALAANVELDQPVIPFKFVLPVQRK